MSSSDPAPGGPQRPKPRPYQPPPGAAKPQAPPPAAKPAEAPGQMAKPTPNVPSGARAAQAAAAAAQGAGGRPAVGVRGGGFEFSFEHDELLKELGKNLHTVAWAGLLAAGILIARFALPFWDAVRIGAWRSAAEPAIFLLVAAVLAYAFFQTRVAGSGFVEIVDSQGQDISLLMQALRSLNRLFSALSLIIIGIGVLVGLAVIGMVALGRQEEPKKPNQPPAKTARYDSDSTGFVSVPMPSIVALTTSPGFRN